MEKHLLKKFQAHNNSLTFTNQKWLHMEHIMIHEYVKSPGYHAKYTVYWHSLVPCSASLVTHTQKNMTPCWVNSLHGQHFQYAIHYYVSTYTAISHS